VDIHEIWLYTVAGEYFVELHLEVPAHLSLAQAHALATQLETRGQNALPNVAAITTHIEPMGETIETALPLEEATVARLKAQAQRVADDICGPGACHNLHLWSEPEALALSMHCTLPPAMSIVDAHELSERVQDALQQQMPQLKRVIVHVEPPLPAKEAGR
jgi:divalent metal cation (Fe/Co/Zn/Cd) transporter